MARHTVERVTCDWGECDNAVAVDAGPTPTGWLLGKVVNRDSGLDLCPRHREDVQEYAANGGD